MGKSSRKTKKAGQGPKSAQPQSFEMPPKAGPGAILAIEEFAEPGSVSNRQRVRNHGEHPLTLAFYRRQLESRYGKEVREQDRITAQERLTAGEEYRKNWECVHRTGRDSTDMSTGVGGSGGDFDPKAAGRKWLKDIHMRMHTRDIVIIQRFCGEGHSMIESLRGARVEFHRDAVACRVREALDDLVAATTGRRIIPTPLYMP